MKRYEKIESDKEAGVLKYLQTLPLHRIMSMLQET